MTFSQLIHVLRARKWLALSVFTVVVVVVVVVSLLLPKQYTASSSVVIDVKPDPVSALAFPTMALPSFMATQVDILNSDRVALRVIRDLRLLENADIRRQWQEDFNSQGTIEQWLVDVLQRNLDVKPSRESNVINVVYKSADPRFAAALANAFAQAYVATTLELRVDPARQFSTFFNAQTKDARESLEQAQSKLSAFQRAKGIIATDERLDVENARLSELSSQMTQLQAIAADSSSRQTQAQGAQAERLQEVLGNPVIGALKADLSRAEARLKELGSRLGDANPQVVEAKANIAELRIRVDAETQRVTGGVVVTNTINRARESQLRRDLEAQRAKVLQMKAVRDEGLVLQRELENAQRLYDGLAARASQTSLESQTTQSYVTVLTAALPPTLPSSPKTLLNSIIAVFAGTLLALATALAIELIDRRVRAPSDVVIALGLPLIGTLPKPGAKRFKQTRQAFPTPASVLSLPRPTSSRGV